jgi:hypothetical protein
MASAGLASAAFAAPAFIVKPGEQGNLRGSPLDYKSYRTTVTVENTYAEVLKLDGLEINIGDDLAYDQSAVLVFEITPLMDLIIVRVINVGWGPCAGGQLQLFAPNAATIDRDQTLATLFDLDPVARQLEAFEHTTFCAYACGRNAVPYTFGATQRFDIRRTQKPPRMIPARVFTSNYNVSHLVPEKIRGDFRYTGTVTFGGEFRSAAGEVEPISYFARTFPRTPTTTARGELCEEFTFAFGGILVKPVYETKTRTHRGITVDLVLQR